MSDEIPADRLEEVERIRAATAADKRSFAEVQARALAKARNETYDPRRHGPFDVQKPPHQQRKEAAKPMNVNAELETIMERFRERGPRYVPKHADKPSRPDTHRKIAP